jgi:two-component system response regulator AtoC
MSRNHQEEHEFLGAKVVYASSSMRDLLARVRQVASCDAAVLVTGESGAGKEAIARAVHYYSRRNEGPWVDINCAALPEHLVESELFGYEKGAFSGADRSKPGLFELASTGTLLLDEIGDIDAKLQVKLLRVLDWREFYRLGGVKKIKVDVRVVASTNSDLRRAVEEGRFRKDLYYRLAQIRLEVPPLRERPEDILALLKMFCQEYQVTGQISPAAIECLLGYSWPGNVRELRSLVIGFLGLTAGREVTPDDLPAEIHEARQLCASSEDSLQHLFEATANGGAPANIGGTGLLDQAERALIDSVLKRTDGHQEKAAAILGISSRTLRRKLQGREGGELGPSRQCFEGV